MKCPKCKGKDLAPQDLLGQVHVDACDACGGMFFEKGEMGTYLKFSDDVPNYKELHAQAKASCACPACGKQMHELRYVPGQALMVDRCSACGGIWLDGGEASGAKSVADKQDDRKLRLMRGVWSMRAAVRGEKVRACPKCKTPSVHEFKTGEGVTLDMCDQCSGCWFEKGEIATYFELSKDVPDLEKSLAASQATDHACPRCAPQKLVSFAYSAIKLPSGHLTVEYCTKCAGVWLDRHEILSLESLSTVLEKPGARLGRAVKELMDKGYVAVGG
jgi:Zn-finger nucleic acid-binding protein